VTLEDRLDRLDNTLRQLTLQIRELTDVYIGAAEAGELSGLIPAAVKIRNRRKDKNSEFREYSLLEARQIFMEYHRVFGDEDSEEWLAKFFITTITDLSDEDINRFCLETKDHLSAEK
jgi:hypothetical protein